MAASESGGEEQEYSVRDIEILRDLEHIRRRPGVYIGSLDARGLHHLVQELIGNALEEHEAGFCTRMGVELWADGGCRVWDDGRGIRVDPMRDGRPYLEAVTTSILYPGAPDERWVAQGLHGIGLVTVNALSERMVLEVRCDGKVWRQEYSRGATTTPLSAVADCTTTGVAVTFWPDPELFKTERTFDGPALRERLRQLAFLNPHAAFEWVDQRLDPPQREILHFPKGCADFVRSLNTTLTPVHPTVLHFRDREDEHELEVALQWVAERDVTIFSFVNGHPTSRGGPHLLGFLQGLHAVLFPRIRDAGLLPPDSTGVAPGDCRAGLTAVVAVNVPDPQFAGATRAELRNPEVTPFVYERTLQHLGDFLHTHPEEARAIVGRVLAARRYRLGALDTTSG
jgi:DNA gyrase subunit B